MFLIGAALLHLVEIALWCAISSSGLAIVVSSFVSGRGLVIVRVLR